MKAFSELIDRLVLTPSRNGKLRLLRDYFATTPDPDRGYALAALTDGLDIPSVKPALLRTLATERIDEVLFAYSYDYVGDLAETVSLIWPEAENADHAHDLTLATVVETLLSTSRTEAPKTFAAILDRLDAPGRYAVIKLVTGGLRIGVSAGLTKQALADLGGRDVIEIEELWHGLKVPYADLFAWLEGKAEKPESATAALFRPVMLANPVEDGDLGGLDIADYRAEWKWDGIRVQLVARHGRRRIYSRTGDEISGSFPDVVQALDFDAVLDGELLVRRGDDVAPFNDLQQRLNRKLVNDKMLEAYPAFVRLYDILFEGEEDLRMLPFDERRARLESFYARHIAGTNLAARFDVSPMIPFSDWDMLREIRAGADVRASEGVMLKRADSPYVAGRPKGLWFKWKRVAATIDAVLMYAQRGHGKRSSFYSDFTFGCWREAPDGGRELVPVGKAYFGFTDAELAQLDRWVRAHTTERFGPVRAVEPRLVCELAFDGVQRSTRHKSGLALRFPRIHRIRWDKPAKEADRIETLAAMIPD